MTIIGERTADAVPSVLDLRRKIRDLREELRARREQEDALRAHLEHLGAETAAAEFRYAELHVCYTELLTCARAAVAADRAGELDPIVHIAGHLEEIGLTPPPDARPERVLAEGLATVTRLEARS